jgi:NADPH-dependent 2,4-dienoyl-CoA reductase/sulfur reductase-like enzyme
VSRERIVVAGAGLAGLRAAERLRELGFEGELVMIGDEPHRPYQRPALSKEFLLGQLTARELALRSYEELDAVWRLGARVEGLDPRRRTLELPGGEPMTYDGLVIATGVQARHLPGLPLHDPRVRAFRTLEDALALQRTLRASDLPVLVLGGGFIASELAASLRGAGRDVVLVSRSPVLMGQVFGDELGTAVGRLHESRGVQLELGTQVSNWLLRDWGVGAHLSTGKLVVAGAVVIANGSVPATGFLRGSGLDATDGVLAGPTCHVDGAEDVVVAGDVARWPNLRFDEVPRRIEHWLNAVEMGRAAADGLLAGPAAAAPYCPVPRFWSELYGIRFQSAGMPGLGDHTIPLGGDPARRRGVLGYRNDRRLLGVIGRDSPRKMVKWTSLLQRGPSLHTRRHPVSAFRDAG